MVLTNQKNLSNDNAATTTAGRTRSATVTSRASLAPQLVVAYVRRTYIYRSAASFDSPSHPSKQENS